MPNTKVLFGSLIAVVLLGLYVFLIWEGIAVVRGSAPAADFTKTMGSTLAVIGGLVSALVIAELAVTVPGEPPVAHAFAPRVAAAGDPAPPAPAWAVGLTSAYVLVWILAGLAAFVFGYLLHDGVVPGLSDLGQSWLGLAVAAAYSYFGIKPR